MIKHNTTTMRVDPEFKKFLEDISIERIKIGKDRKLTKLPRISKAIVRVPNLKEVLVSSSFKDEY